MVRNRSVDWDSVGFSMSVCRLVIRLSRPKMVSYHGMPAAGTSKPFFVLMISDRRSRMLVSMTLFMTSLSVEIWVSPRIHWS